MCRKRPLGRTGRKHLKKRQELKAEAEQPAGEETSVILVLRGVTDAEHESESDDADDDDWHGLGLRVDDPWHALVAAKEAAAGEAAEHFNMLCYRLRDLPEVEVLCMLNKQFEAWLDAVAALEACFPHEMISLPCCRACRESEWRCICQVKCRSCGKPTWYWGKGGPMIWLPSMCLCLDGWMWHPFKKKR